MAPAVTAVTMTSGPTDDWLDKFALITRAEVLRIWRPDSCIASTRIGLAVLDEFGHAARPVVTAVLAANAHAARLIDQGVPIPQWPYSAWSVGVTGRGEHRVGGFDGHVVLTLRRPGCRRLLIDLSADQMDRPARDLRVRGPIIATVPKLWTPDSPVTLTTEDRVVITYEPVLGLTMYQNSSDWTGKTELVDEVVQRVVGRLRAGS